MSGGFRTDLQVAMSAESITVPETPAAVRRDAQQRIAARVEDPAALTRILDRLGLLERITA